MTVGAIVFGPVPDKGSASGFSIGHGVGIKADATVYPCNCIGPQPGQSKCPCALRGEAEHGRRMIADGVTINGRRYLLVPA